MIDFRTYRRQFPWSIKPRVKTEISDCSAQMEPSHYDTQIMASVSWSCPYFLLPTFERFVSYS